MQMESRSSTSIDVADIPYGKKKDHTKYLYQPPTIKPNYGKVKKDLMPKTHIPKVVLYDNTMRQLMCDIKVHFFNHQQYRIKRIYEKSRHTLSERLNFRQKMHEVWDSRYKNMKDAFIAQYGTENMPVPEDEPDEYEIFNFVKLAPPINILCYFLASGNDPRKRKEKKRERIAKMRQMLTRDKLGDYLKRRGQIPEISQRLELPAVDCVADFRFKALKETLIEPKCYTDGYLQISPGYGKGNEPRRLDPYKARKITLPRFYARLQMQREGSACSNVSQQSVIQRSTSLSIIEDNRTSISSLS